MTVAELIERLRELPGDVEVTVIADAEYMEPMSDAALWTRDGPMGDLLPGRLDRVVVII